MKFLFIQCLGYGKVSRFLEKAFVFLKNVTMFFMVFLIFCVIYKTCVFKDALTKGVLS